MRLPFRIDNIEQMIRKRKRGVTTVHYMFPLVAVAFGMFGASYLSGGSSYVILTPSPQYVESGAGVEILVEAVAHTPVNTVDIEVAFPADQLKITSVDTGDSVITLWTTEPTIENNKVHLRGGVFRKGFMGRHTIARINARAVNDGDADVLVRNSIFLAGDGKGTPISIDPRSNKQAAIQIGKTSLVNAKTSITGKVSVAVFTDIDGDKDVDFADIQAFMSAWRSGLKIYDFSGDGRMTFRDFAIILSDSFFK